MCVSKHADEKRAILQEKLTEGRGLTVFTCKPDDPLMVEMPLEPPVGATSMLRRYGIGLRTTQ